MERGRSQDREVLRQHAPHLQRTDGDDADQPWRLLTTPTDPQRPRRRLRPGDYQHAVADRGAVLEFHMIGMGIDYPGEGQSPEPSETASAVVALVDAGHGPAYVPSSSPTGCAAAVWTQRR